MKRLSLVSLTFLTHIALAVTILFAATLMGYYATNRMLAGEVQRQLERAQPLLVGQLRKLPDVSDVQAIDDLCKRLFQESGFRYTVMDLQGNVLGDGEQSPDRMLNHAGRPEYRSAILHGAGTDRRVSASVQREMIYHAAVESFAGDQQFVVRIALDIQALREPMEQLRRAWSIIGILLLLISLAVSAVVTRWVTRPLLVIRAGVRRFTQGQFDVKIPACQLKDADALADDLNRMADRLDNRIRKVEQQREEENALLRSMVEGVVAVDPQRDVLRMNQSAAQLLGVRDVEAAKGKSVLTFLRTPEWVALLDRVLGGESPVEGYVELDDGKLVLQVHGVALTGQQKRNLGALLVFTDVTVLSRVDTMQREFVANVSHELKTPITAITGFVEALLEHPDDDEETRRRFLGIVLKQVGRLQTIVSDILSLAALENGMRHPEQDREVADLCEILENAILPCRAIASQKSITIALDCQSQDKVRIYPFFLEQAVMNLVDNAIKYSPEGSVVSVVGRGLTDQIVIRVSDNGPGIAPEHHARLWERFYRVDRGRSRRVGGTGLGLAIVRRVALLHGGRCTVQSASGKGSTFSMLFPRQRG
ncbi:MAG: ATP-binding protein [Kiritimatiellia bacterium]